MMMRRRDWALLAIASANGEPVTPAQLQKCLFLLGQVMASTVGRPYYAFKPHNYGPLSAAIYEDADQLEVEGLVRIDRGQPGRSWSLYFATAEGLAHAKKLDVPSAARNYLRQVMAWARGLSFSELIASIYEAYPEQRENSIFVD